MGLKRLLLFGGILLCLTGCKEYVTEYSKLKHEEAEVVDKRTGFHYPSGYYYNITFKGDMYLTINNEGIYDIFNLNDKADLSYREIYQVTLEDIDKDGRKEVTERKFLDYIFVDAVPVDEIKK